MVLAFGILITDLRIGATKTQKNILILLGVTILFVFLKAISFPSLFAGLFLLALAVIITVQEYNWGIIGRDHEDKILFKYFHKERITILEILLFPFLAIGIIAGGILVVSSTEQISRISGYSTTILGLTLTAISTSLPELIATYVSRKDGKGKIAIGDILGSNIYNLLLIGGIITLFSINSPIILTEAFWLIFSTLCFVVIIRYFSDKIVPKWVGLVLLMFFLMYLFSLSVK